MWCSLVPSREHRFVRYKPSILHVVLDFGRSRANLQNTNRTWVLSGSCSIRTEQNEGIVRFCSMWRRTRTNRTGPRKCSVLFVCAFSHLCAAWIALKLPQCLFDSLWRLPNSLLITSTILSRNERTRSLWSPDIMFLLISFATFPKSCSIAFRSDINSKSLRTACTDFGMSFCPTRVFSRDACQRQHTSDLISVQRIHHFSGFPFIPNEKDDGTMKISASSSLLLNFLQSLVKLLGRFYILMTGRKP